MFEQIEHPDITSICRTGYPTWINADPEPLGECYICGEGIYEDLSFDDNNRAIHRECEDELCSYMQLESR